MENRYLHLKELCSAFIELSDEALNNLYIYEKLLIEWNEKINLTAITKPEEVVIKHFYDCLLTFSAVNIKKGAKIIDVGTGAGFPGLVLKIARPDLDVTLLDSLNKRLAFLQEVLKAINLEAELVHSRAEDSGLNPLYREKYDYAFSRAVARQQVLLEYTLPFVKKGGYFVALKGPAAQEELKECANALKLLGGETESVIKKSLPQKDERTFIVTKKISQTNTKYPRKGVKISKKPL